MCGNSTYQVTYGCRRKEKSRRKNVTARRAVSFEQFWFEYIYGSNAVNGGPIKYIFSPSLSCNIRTQQAAAIMAVLASIVHLNICNLLGHVIDESVKWERWKLQSKRFSDFFDFTVFFFSSVSSSRRRLLSNSRNSTRQLISCLNAFVIFFSFLIENLDEFWKQLMSLWFKRRKKTQKKNIFSGSTQSQKKIKLWPGRTAPCWEQWARMCIFHFECQITLFDTMRRKKFKTKLIICKIYGHTLLADCLQCSFHGPTFKNREIANNEWVRRKWNDHHFFFVIHSEFGLRMQFDTYRWPLPNSTFLCCCNRIEIEWKRKHNATKYILIFDFLNLFLNGDCVWNQFLSQ